jgi:hypothetical protein
MKNVLKATEDDVSRRTVRELDFAGEPGERVDDTKRSCFPDPNGVAPVGFECRAGIPAIKAMNGPCFACGGFFVRNDAATGEPMGVRLKSKIPWT